MMRARQSTWATCAGNFGALSTASDRVRSDPRANRLHDIVRTTCYLRDIERDYEAFNEERTRFYKEQGLDPVLASTGIQAILCRPDLLIEIEAIAMFRQKSPSE